LRRLGALDWLLLATLLPLWLGGMALSVWHARAHPPGNVAFGALADGPLRDGQPLSMPLPTTRFVPWSWWAALAFSASNGLSGLLLLLRARGWHLARRYFVASVLWSVVLTSSFITAGCVWTYLGYVTRFGFWGPAAAVTVWNALEWTPSALSLRPWQKALAWGVLALGLAYGASVDLGRPEPQVLLLSSLTAATGVAVLYGYYRCHRRADAGERRQLRWVFFGFGFAFSVQTLAALLYLAYLAGESGEPIVVTTIGNVVVLSGIAMPIGLGISIVGYRYLDIDRLISGTAATAITAAGLAAAALAVVPPLAQSASAALGIEPVTVQLALSMALAALLVPAYRWIHPRLERQLFPEREAIGAGFARLLDEISARRDPSELVRVASEGIDSLMRPESIVTYAREGEAFTPVFARGRALPPAFDASSPLVSALRARSGPLAPTASCARRPSRSRSSTAPRSTRSRSR